MFTEEQACRQCASYALCQPTEDGRTRLASRRRILKKGAHLFRTGDPFRAIYVIESGCIKTSMLTCGGDVQVLRFSLPGELVGINAIGNDHHPCDAMALETTQLCELPFAQVEKLAQENAAVQHRLLGLLSEEIVMDEKLMAMLGHQKAETRMANCLLNFSQRYQQQSRTDRTFRLPMSRQDLGDYLGLSLETVSRLFSRFQAEGLLSVQGRKVHLLDLPRLESVAEHCSQPIAARA
jgi:CRP/FNR family transcriptional regulator